MVNEGGSVSCPGRGPAWRSSRPPIMSLSRGHFLGCKQLTSLWSESMDSPMACSWCLCTCVFYGDGFCTLRLVCLWLQAGPLGALACPLGPLVDWGQFAKWDLSQKRAWGVVWDHLPHLWRLLFKELLLRQLKPFMFSKQSLLPCCLSPSSRQEIFLDLLSEVILNHSTCLLYSSSFRDAKAPVTFPCGLLYPVFNILRASTCCSKVFPVRNSACFFCSCNTILAHIQFVTHQDS